MMKKNKDVPASVTTIPIDELLKLDNQLCFALYVCSKEIIKKYKPLLDPLGLTYTCYITLLALWEEDNINVKELGKKLYLDSGTLTPILKKLEGLGLVHRKRSQTDERNVFISLSKEGFALKEKATSIPKDLVCSLSGDGTTPSAPMSAIDLLSDLHKLMRTLTEL